MLTKNLDLTEAQQQFPEIISWVKTGIEVILYENNQPLIRLTPIAIQSLSADEPLSPRVLGLHEGQGWISDDFKEPLPDEFWLGT
jgi:antitoxin (DNA-binding transcriptional repressor) of toxin-antitoxin stability system